MAQCGRTCKAFANSRSLRELTFSFCKSLKNICIFKLTFRQTVFHKPHCASLPNVRCNCKMTTFKKILILTILFYNINNIVGQNKYHQFEDKNSTGRNVRLHQTMYDKDSTKSGYAHYFCSKCKSKGDDVTYIGLIRLDVIAIDDSTNDTLFIKTYNSDELNQDPFILNITNSKNKLQLYAACIHILYFLL